MVLIKIMEKQLINQLMFSWIIFTWIYLLKGGIFLCGCKYITVNPYCKNYFSYIFRDIKKFLAWSTSKKLTKFPNIYLESILGQAKNFFSPLSYFLCGCNWRQWMSIYSINNHFICFHNFLIIVYFSLICILFISRNNYLVMRCGQISLVAICMICH